MTHPRSSRVTSVAAGPVRADDMLVRLWGDDEAGWVNDWVYVSSEKLYQIVLSMPAGASFRHSERNRTVFGADELYLVLEGSFLLANPQTGEVLRLEAGDAAWFGPDTWHHGFVVGGSEAKVLEYFAPPPAAGASQDHARTRPYLHRNAWRYADVDPDARATLHPIDPRNTLWRLEGERQELLVGVLLSTSELTVATGEIRPATRTDDRSHEGDLGIFVRDGNLTVILPGDGAARDDVHDLRPWDGFYIPARTPYRLANSGTRRTSFVFGVAPGVRTSG